MDIASPKASVFTGSDASFLEKNRNSRVYPHVT